MTTSNLMSLPIDIPWKRLGTSKDMMDNKPDRSYPPKWRSSLAVFYYEPPADEQKLENRVITYLKVTCTITGLQKEGSYDDQGNLAEVHLPPKDLLPEWKWNAWQNYNQSVRAYYPCYGAMLQVAVFPGGVEGQQPPVEKFPYILDFEPKKREMYESSIEKAEVLSQSRSGINTKKGTTDLEYSEFSAEAWASYGGKNAGVGAALNYKQGTRHETVDQTTADYSREKRESYSYTTNLSHMYTLLNSYHLGTNRAMYLVQPRPHTMNTDFTFVNGPRELEGIQEFFLIVERPKDIPNLCVEATLETAHFETGTIYWPRLIPMSELYVSDNLKKTALALGITKNDKTEYAQWLEEIVLGRWGDKGQYKLKSGGEQQFHLFRKNEVCLRRGWNNLALDERAKLIEAYKKGDLSSAFPEELQPSTIGFNVSLLLNDFRYWYLPDNDDWIRENPGHLMGLITAVLGKNENIGVQDAAVIYERVQKRTGNFFLTGRTTTNCSGQTTWRAAVNKQDFITWESKIDIPSKMEDPFADNLSRAAAANELINTIGKKMVQSLSDPNRLPYGELAIEDASFIQETIREAIKLMPENDPYNVPLNKIDGLSTDIKRRLEEVYGVKTRKEALAIEPYQLRSGLNLTEPEAKRLRTLLIGNGPQFETKPGEILMPNVEGLSLKQGLELLRHHNLRANEKIVYKDALEPRDIVLNQYPDVGTSIKKEEIVNLVVSSGPVLIPDVAGLPLDEAKEKLSASPLRVEINFVVTNRLPDGCILETTPLANTAVTRNSQIILFVAESKGATRSKQKK